jgi:hypothetical protein
LDERLIDERSAPYLCELRSRHQVASLRTYPSTELVPTIISGVLPHEHRVWQVRLKPEYRAVVGKDLADWLPDTLVSTLQCARYFFDHSYDLAVIPWRRRRRFELHRFKYTRRAATDEPMQAFAGYKSIFGLLKDQSRYLFTKDFSALPSLVDRLATGDRLIEFLEMYALDLVQHWHLDNPEVMRDSIARTDAFVRAVHARCTQNGVRFMLLVDHGQERVTGTIPLMQFLAGTRIPQTEYSFIVELASARFWFHTDRARRQLLEALATLPGTVLQTRQQMHAHGIRFEEDDFGEIYVFAEAGRIFFPHDFYQPIANTFLGLIDRHQRQRLLRPVHRGNHGYLPDNACERGWLLMDDPECIRPSVDLIDIAPSLLSLVGVEPPDYMKGTPFFPKLRME